MSVVAWYAANMLSVKVSTKHQISLPSEARRRLGIEAGDRLSVELDGDAMVLRRRPERPSERLRGLGSKSWQGVDAVDHVRKLRESSEKRR
jgi:AbrB family looped-hinge helix DNA binding protein